MLRKVFLLFLVVVASALGLVLLSRQKSNVPLLLFNILADASLGLLAGLAARFALRGRHGFIQGLASAATSLVGLAILGYFTNWKSGIGPFQAGWVTVHWLSFANIPSLRLPLQFGRSTMDLLDLAHMVIAVDMSWIALRVWKPRPRVVGQAPAPAQRSRRPARSNGSRPARPAAVQAPPVQSAPAVSRSPSVSRSYSRPKVKHNRVNRLVPQPRSTVRPMRAKARRGRSLFGRGRPAVHLAVYEEHKCPYCLEPVSRNDPRGTVECPICHTLHHKDCWDITGNCQVPHLTA